MARCCQPPALDGREVAAHAVHLADGRARLEQRAAQVLLVGQSQARRSQGQQRRATARDQAQHQVVLAHRGHQVEQALRGFFTGCIGHRVGRLDDLDALARHAVAIACHHQTRQRALPGIFHRACHGRRRLASADHDQAPGAQALRRGQVGRNAVRRLRRRHGGVKHAPQQCLRAGLGTSIAIGNVGCSIRVRGFFLHGPGSLLRKQKVSLQKACGRFTQPSGRFRSSTSFPGREPCPSGPRPCRHVPRRN